MCGYSGRVGMIHSIGLNLSFMYSPSNINGMAKMQQCASEGICTRSFPQSLRMSSYTTWPLQPSGCSRALHEDSVSQLLAPLPKPSDVPAVGTITAAAATIAGEINQWIAACVA